MADAIKLPDRDVVNLNPPTTSDEEIVAVMFEDLASLEIIEMTRLDTIKGMNQIYSIISDLSTVNIRYDPSIIVSNRGSFEKTLNEFPISLSSRIPEEEYYDENDYGKPTYDLAPNVYWDGENVVIELENMQNGEFLEVQVIESAKINTVRENDY